MSIQIREADDAGTPNGLKVHAAAAETGLPACGTLVRPWHGKEMIAVPTEAEVTCLRVGCAR